MNVEHQILEAVAWADIIAAAIGRIFPKIAIAAIIVIVIMLIRKIKHD